LPLEITKELSVFEGSNELRVQILGIFGVDGPLQFLVIPLYPGLFNWTAVGLVNPLAGIVPTKVEHVQLLELTSANGCVNSV
jgi:hypothetical protein